MGRRMSRTNSQSQEVQHRPRVEENTVSYALKYDREDLKMPANARAIVMDSEGRDVQCAWSFPPEI